MLISYPLNMLQEPMVTVASSAIALLLTIIYCISSVYFVDLTAQFVQQSKKEGN